MSTMSTKEQPLTGRERLRVGGGLLLLGSMAAASVFGVSSAMHRSHENNDNLPKPTGVYVNIVPSHDGEGINEIANDLANGPAVGELKNELQAVAQQNGGQLPNESIGVDSSLVNETNPDVLKAYDIAINQQGQPYNPDNKPQ